MALTAYEPGAMADLRRSAWRWLHGWWRIVHLGTTLIVLALSPASYDAPQRSALARHVYLGSAPALVWFSVLSALLSLIVIRIVLVTSFSYGLSQYAIEMVVRVLVLELIPLTAALFAALRCTLPQAADVATLRADGGWAGLSEQGQDPVRREVLPRVAAGIFAVCLLAAVSCGLTLVLAYVSVYGFNTTGFAAYTRTVGHVFNPAVALIFVMKIVFFALAVALIPIASVLYDRPHPRLGLGSARPPEGAQTLSEGVGQRPWSASLSTELQGLVRMFLLLLLIEATSLVGNYY